MNWLLPQILRLYNISLAPKIENVHIHYISGYYFAYLGYFYSEIKINLFSTDSIKKKTLTLYFINSKMTVVYYRRLDVNFSMCRYTNTILFSAWQHCVNEDSFIHDNTLSFTIFPGEINEMNLM